MREHVSYIQKQISSVSSEKQNLETKIHCSEFSSSLAQKNNYLVQNLSFKKPSQGGSSINSELLSTNA